MFSHFPSLLRRNRSGFLWARTSPKKERQKTSSTVSCLAWTFKFLSLFRSVPPQSRGTLRKHDRTEALPPACECAASWAAEQRAGRAAAAPTPSPAEQYRPLMRNKSCIVSLAERWWWWDERQKQFQVSQRQSQNNTTPELAVVIAASQHTWIPPKSALGPRASEQSAPLRQSEALNLNRSSPWQQQLLVWLPQSGVSDNLSHERSRCYCLLFSGSTVKCFINIRLTAAFIKQRDGKADMSSLFWLTNQNKVTGSGWCCSCRWVWEESTMILMWRKYCRKKFLKFKSFSMRNHLWRCAQYQGMHLN